jgi:hypothetical protein
MTKDRIEIFLSPLAKAEPDRIAARDDQSLDTVRRTSVGSFIDPGHNAKRRGSRGLVLVGAPVETGR